MGQLGFFKTKVKSSQYTDKKGMAAGKVFLQKLRGYQVTDSKRKERKKKAPKHFLSWVGLSLAAAFYIYFKSGYVLDGKGTCSQLSWIKVLSV